MTDDSERPWLVGVWPRDAQGVLQVGEHGARISRDEMEVLSRALNLASELNGNSLLTSGQDAANALFAKLDEVAASGNWLTVELRASVSAALGAWLGTITSSRVALEDASRRYFSADEQVGREFEAAFADNAHFRLAWELRNALHHEGDVAKYVRYSSRLVDDGEESVVEERIDLPRLLASPHLGKKARAALERLWGLDASPDLGEVVSRATDVPGDVFSALLLRNEAVFVEAIETIARAYAGAADGENAVYLYQVFPSPNDGALTINARPVDASLIGFLALNVNTARRQAGLDPLYGPAAVVV